jgi:hypothetical protein
MTTTTVTFKNPLNQSLQTGDVIYFQKNDDVLEFGECVSIDDSRTIIVVEVPDTNVRPEANSFFMFAKNNVINTSGLVGYHATVALENDSTDFTELFAVNSEINISSN